MTKEDMRSDDFNIKVIADVSCDIDGPVPSTIRVSTIAEPLYGYNPLTNKESEPFDKGSITVMAVDNLPGELPRDASEEFGRTLLDKILPSLLVLCISLSSFLISANSFFSIIRQLPILRRLFYNSLYHIS